MKGPCLSIRAFRDLCGLPPDLETGIWRPWNSGWNRLHPEDRPQVMRPAAAAARGERRSDHHRVPLPESWSRPKMDPAPGRGLHARRRRAGGRHLSGSCAISPSAEKPRNELHKLSRRLINAHEDERALLARELHDDLTQRLAVLAIEVGSSESAVEDPASVQTLQAVREELVRLSEDIHSLAYHLHPSVLTELGLVEALRAEVRPAGSAGPGQGLSGPGPASPGPGEGRGALPVPRGAGGAEQRRPSCRHRRSRDHAAADRRGGAPHRPGPRSGLRPGVDRRGRSTSAW